MARCTNFCRAASAYRCLITMRLMPRIRSHSQSRLVMSWCRSTSFVNRRRLHSRRRRCRPQVVSSHLISTHPISSHFISFRLMTSHLTSPHLISTHPIPSHPIPSHLISSHLISSVDHRQSALLRAMGGGGGQAWCTPPAGHPSRWRRVACH